MAHFPTRYQLQMAVSRMVVEEVTKQVAKEVSSPELADRIKLAVEEALEGLGALIRTAVKEAVYENTKAHQNGSGSKSTKSDSSRTSSKVIDSPPSAVRVLNLDPLLGEGNS